MYKKQKIVILLLLVVTLGYSQVPFEVRLDSLSLKSKGLNDVVRIDLSGLTLYDFLTTIAEEHKLNVSADGELNQLVTSNFFDVNVKDVFLFLIKKYDLQADIINNIIVFAAKEEVKKIAPPKLVKTIDVSFNRLNKFLSIKLKNDSLPSVAQAIADVSGKNIILSPNIKNEKVSAYILNRPYRQVLDMMAKSNGLLVTEDEDDNFYFEKDSRPKEVIKTNSRTNSRTNRSRNNSNRENKGEAGSYEMSVDAQGYLSIKAFEADANDLINEAAEKLNVNFLMYDTPEGVNTTLVANAITFDNLLQHLFKGEKYTYKQVDDLYFLGEHTTEGLRTTELVQLENRSIESVEASLPKWVKENLEVKEFVELNGFVVSGSKSYIEEFRDYIYQIDLVVPVVQIEVIFVQYQKSYEIQTGLQTGINSEDRTTSGVLFPTTDVAMNSSSVNSLIDAFNGLGIVKLGKVTKNFYLNLRALENNSLIKLSSTPKLVTLNGHTANSSIGQTDYYFEQSNQLITRGVTDGILQSGSWKPTEANLSINITPFVSKDENVTLNISVEKNSFLGRAGENAPPGKATQQFESMVRVKNNEMVLLGGLEELENENSGTGTPFLSRIPVIKWFFSSRVKSKEKSKLHIFIKPTVMY
ncbi:type II secretion system protein GspD [Olleya sp. HaHaR_3_96]|uniref:type II secretion system protein GspD n=1 Tax=Olleya sp. HaHaR_3_96 TaxID=2745560 RepID=UPI001C4E4A7D|nr:type II and III secretion system protein [Olleya sp. HaHaR_3_96]QXP58403.1 type II and III secretion system protein [Olleya sp. HaHaR_3_96]